VELVTESFTSTGAVEKDTVIPAGGARALTVVYGTGRCGGEAAPPVSRASARLVVSSADGDPDDGADGSAATQEIELALPYPDDTLAMLLRTDCAVQLVAEAADVRFGPWSPRADGVLQGSLVVERRAGDEPITIRTVTGSVLFKMIVDLPDPDPPIGTLPPGQRRLEIPMLADAARCTGHAIGEAKQRFLFRTWVSIGPVADLATTVTIDQAGQDQLEQMLQVRCGL
jgi:hypothetical protein